MSFRCDTCKRACPLGLLAQHHLRHGPCEHRRPAVHNEKGGSPSVPTRRQGTRIVSQHMRQHLRRQAGAA